MKLLSIVVPCYNSQEYMEACIDSLLAGGDRVEIIIIDDGSTDNTAKIADGYEKKYPSVVKVIHQENGGHGEGINQGVRRASGKYFKVVDSDDKLSGDLPAFLDLLEGEANDADLIVNNFVYTYADPSLDKEMHYRGLFKENAFQNWDETKRFPINRYLMIHACTFRTDVVKKSGIVLPKHTFYEDNLYICGVLPFTDNLYYADLDLYRYTIGREGQSVSEAVSVRRFRHHLQVAGAAFRVCRLDDVKKKSKKLGKLLYGEMRLLFGIGSEFARRTDDPEGETLLKELWRSAYEHDRKYARKLRYSVVWFLNIPGKPGRFAARVIYDVAHKIVKFN